MTFLAASTTQAMSSGSMSDALKIVLTALLTVCVFVIGQMIQRLFIEPIQEQRKTVARVAHAVTFYRNQHNVFKFNSPKDQEERKEWIEKDVEANERIRSLAGDLRASMAAIPLYGLLEAFRLVTPKDMIRRVVHELFFWSKLDPRAELSIRRIRGLLDLQFNEPQSGAAIDEFEKETDEIVARKTGKKRDLSAGGRSLKRS